MADIKIIERPLLLLDLKLIVKKAIGLDYRNDKYLIDSQRKKYNNEN